jgi:hypothetical protein
LGTNIGNQNAIQEEIKNYLRRSLKIKIKINNCRPHQILYCDQIENGKMGLACSMYGGEKRFIQDFGGKTLGKETN